VKIKKNNKDKWIISKIKEDDEEYKEKYKELMLDSTDE
jgi:hypothetical protein